MTTGAKKVTWTSGKSQGFLGEPDRGDIEDEKAHAHLMRTLSVLLDQIVDVMFPCTRADTLDAARAANAPDNGSLDLAYKMDRS